MGLNDTVREARRDLFGAMHAGEGVICPCCDQRAQIYRRPINGQMAHGLALLYAYDQKHPGEYVHLSHYFTEKKTVTGNDGSLLRFWFLIEPQDGSYTATDHGKDHSGGYYRITQSGRDFIEGNDQVAKYAFTYNERLLGWSGPNAPWGKETWVSISDVWGTPFDLNEVMRLFDEDS